MYKKSVFLIAPFIVSFTTTVFSEQVFCPPRNAVHCTKGICIVDPPYANQWRLFVTRYPDGSPDFFVVTITKPPAKAICQYGYDSNHSPGFLTLHSLSNFSPDLKAAGNQWMLSNEELKLYGCWETIKACPMQAAN